MVKIIGAIINNKQFNIFAKKNLTKYVINKLCGLYRYQKLNPHKLLYIWESFIVLLNFYFLRRLYIPQVEFILTTKCTLSCKNCSYSIPEVHKKADYVLSCEDFKLQIDNLLKNIYKLNSLIFVGGETILNPEFIDILLYALNLRKVEKVYFFTNGTILFSDKLISVLKKYRNKVCVYVSNYTSNPMLKGVLKTHELLNLLKVNKINYIFDEKQIWVLQDKIEPYNRSKENDSNVYISCKVPTVSVVRGEMHLCPKASVAKMLGLLNFKETDFLNLNQVVTKEQIINFYSQDLFTICRNCPGPHALKHLIKPAEQTNQER